jgi:beta-N-acetylhexosaminidase
VKRTSVLALTAAAGIAATSVGIAATRPAGATAQPLAGAQPAGARPVAAAPSAAALASAATSVDRYPDPAQWTSWRLAGQLTYACVDAAATTTMESLAARGVGGIALLGDDAPSDLRSRLASVRAAAPNGVAPMIGSDEEGGLVQRLAHVIYPLPSAETMGTWSPSHIEETAYEYGLRMREIGVPTAFAPDSDLGIPGYYIESLHRAFSRYPDHVATDVKAWMAGLRRAHVVATVKHWPGHGQATNTHTGAATIPPLSTLEVRDMIPFNAAFAAGVPEVMVGHLMSDGLTDPGWPATLSPKALHYLRAKAGPRTVIMTDSLSMAAATSAVGLTTTQAAVRAIRSGADIALACAPKGVIAAIAKAIDSGWISRAQAVASARRVMPLKARAGLIQGYTGPMPSTLQAHLNATTVAKGGADAIWARLSGGYRNVYLQELTNGSWHSLRSFTTGRLGYLTIPIRTGTAGERTFRLNAPWAYPYAAKISPAMTVTITG